jgi:hypothetical protein
MAEPEGHTAKGDFFIGAKSGLHIAHSFLPFISLNDNRGALD